MSKWSNTPKYNKVLRMVPIEYYKEVRDLLERSDAVISYRIIYRGPRRRLTAGKLKPTNPLKKHATDFTAYIEMVNPHINVLPANIIN